VLSRHRSPAGDPFVEARVGRLLVRPGVSGGWVPPEPDDEPDADQPPEPARSWAADPPGDEGVGAAEPPLARPGLLPATLAGGRLDPGHRGAVALLLVCLLAAVVAAGLVLRGRPQEVEVPVLDQAGTTLPGVVEPSSAPPAEPTELVVAVVGEVAAPGVVRLPAGSRVADAVQAAGGVAPGGSSGLLNLARKLSDGEQVVVGPDAPPDAAATGTGDGAGAGGLVDLNTATAEQLDGLPGIGPVLAERIVGWRSENGPFRSVDQLREVSGIGEATYADLESEVTV
jgi:competence protein ComEA